MQSKQSFHTDNEEIVCFYTPERKKSHERTALVLILNWFSLSFTFALVEQSRLIRVFAPTSFKGLVEVDIALILAHESILEGADNTLYMFPFWLSE